MSTAAAKHLERRAGRLLLGQQEQCSVLNARDSFRVHAKVFRALGDLNDDMQDLLTTAKRIRAGLSEMSRAARNPVAQQTHEEWLQAYDRAPLMPHQGGV